MVQNIKLETIDVVDNYENSIVVEQIFEFGENRVVWLVLGNDNERVVFCQDTLDDEQILYNIV
jgi:hypothetical protein